MRFGRRDDDVRGPGNDRTPRVEWVHWPPRGRSIHANRRCHAPVLFGLALAQGSADIDTELQIFTGPPDDAVMGSVAFGPDGSPIPVADPRIVPVRAVAAGDITMTLGGNDDPVDSLVFGSDGTVGS